MSKKEKKFNVRTEGSVAVVEVVETTEERKEITIDQIESMVNDTVKKKLQAEKMLEQVDAESKELKDLLTDAIAGTKDKGFKERLKEAKARL